MTLRKQPLIALHHIDSEIVEGPKAVSIEKVERDLGEIGVLQLIE